MEQKVEAKRYATEEHPSNNPHEKYSKSFGTPSSPIEIELDHSDGALNLKRNLTVSVHRLDRRKGLRRQWTSSLIAALSYFILGTALGWPSPVLYRIEKEQEPVQLSHFDSTLMVTLFYAGNLLMPIPSGLLSDWLGRKASLLYLTILPVASWVFIWVVAHKVMLHIARFFMGMYSGMALTVLPMYMGEIAEPDVRGKLASILQLFTNCGLVFAYVVGAHTSYGTFAIMLGVFPLVHFFLLLLIPESPYWLTFKGRDEDAAKILAWLRGGNMLSSGVGAEADVIMNSVHADTAKSRSLKTLFTNKSYRKALVIVEMFSVSQRFSGISALMAYISITVPLIPEHGLTANLCAIFIGCAYIIGVVLALPLVDRLGRIPLMIISCSGCGIAMLLAAVWYYMYGDNIHEGSWKWVPLTVFSMYGVFMNLGLGPVPTTVQGEMFPSHLKGKASAVTVMILAASSVVVNFSYIPIADSVGFWLNFLGYTCVCVGCLIFTLTYAIETKGKTLQEIQTRLTE